MRTNSLWALVGFLIMGAALWMTLTSSNGSESRWSTDYGPMELRVANDGFVEGTYPDHQGRVVGLFRPGEQRIIGFWEQPNSEQPCAETRGETNAWGRFTWTFDGRTRLLGAWSYCDVQPTGDSMWDGTFVDGVHPLDAEVDPDIN